MEGQLQAALKQTQEVESEYDVTRSRGWGKTLSSGKPAGKILTEYVQDLESNL